MTDVTDCTVEHTSALLRKGAYGSGAEKEVSSDPSGALIEKRLGHWDSGRDCDRFGASGTQAAELVNNIYCEQHSVPSTLCQRDITVVQGDDGGGQGNPSEFSAEYAGNNSS